MSEKTRQTRERVAETAGIGPLIVFGPLVTWIVAGLEGAARESVPERDQKRGSCAREHAGRGNR